MDAERATRGGLSRGTWILGAVVFAFEALSHLTEEGKFPSTGKIIEVAFFVAWMAAMMHPLMRLRGRTPTRLTHLHTPRVIVALCAVFSAPGWLAVAAFATGRTSDGAIVAVIAGACLSVPILMLLRLKWELENPEATPILETPRPRYQAEPAYATWQGRAAMVLVAAGMWWILSERLDVARRLPRDRAWWGWLNLGTWGAFFIAAVIGGAVNRRRWAAEERAPHA